MATADGLRLAARTPNRHQIVIFLSQTATTVVIFATARRMRLLLRQSLTGFDAQVTEPAPSAAFGSAGDAPPARRPPPAADTALLRCRGLQAGFRQTPALVDIDLAIGAREILAVTGLAGAGKSTLLRCFNRMNDVIAGFRVGGEILFRGRNLYGRDIDLTVLRTRIGMVSSRPNPFPRSIQENIAYAACLHGRACGILEQEQIVETALRQVDLWNLLRNKLGAPALSLSRGQQQRLCLARALALQPEVLLLDEPTAGMDSLEAGRFENLIGELAEHRTLILATQSVNLAARVSQRMGFLHQGRLIEIGPTRELFTQPRRTLTEAYLTGRLLDL